MKRIGGQTDNQQRQHAMPISKSPKTPLYFLVQRASGAGRWRPFENRGRMELKTLIILLPFAFTIHNIEEVFGMEKWSNSIPSYIHKPVTIKQFGIAVLIFSILGFVISFTKGVYSTEEYYYLIIAGFAGMILINVFIPYLLATIYLRKYSPGIITGLVMNLPVTVLILVSLNQSHILSIKQIVTSTIIGGIIGAFLAYTFLGIGNYFGKNKNNRPHFVSVMAGDVVNSKVCIPIKLHFCLTGKNLAICYYSYNLPLCFMQKTT
jgi:hypothetical protein